jgi:hypothetical protein
MNDCSNPSVGSDFRTQYSTNGCVTQITREQLDTIDLDRVVAKAVQHIDWSEHIDWYQLASHMEIDYTDLCRYIEIDSSELADELKDKIQLSILIQ